MNSKVFIRPVIAVFLMLATMTVMAGQPAARVGDPNSTGGVILPPGSPTVLIANMPAARVGDLSFCISSIPQVPSGPAPIIIGSPTVLIGGMPAARVGDLISCNTGPAAIVIGAFTVQIGP